MFAIKRTLLYTRPRHRFFASYLLLSRLFTPSLSIEPICKGTNAQCYLGGLSKTTFPGNGIAGSCCQYSTMSHLYTKQTPETVKNAKGLHLITQSTPNGQKVQIFLEELKDHYGTEWTTDLLNIGTNEQKKDWYLRLNPNGRIPTLIDNTQSTPFPVMETSAILLHLLKNVDKDDQFGFKDELERSECLQWMFFWHGSGQPIQGQNGFFNVFSKEKVPLAMERFHKETLRVFGVLEIRLSGKYTADGKPREYLAGSGAGKYSVADITTWTWVKGYKFGKFTDEEMAEFPNLLKWIDRIAARPAVQRGIGEDYDIAAHADRVIHTQDDSQ